VFALSIALVAMLGVWGARRYVLVPAAIASLMAIPVGTLRANPDGRVIYETETPYQYAQVVQHEDGSRALELNEGQARHSLYRPGTVLTGDYWDEFLVLPFASADRAPRRIAILGNAAGTTARAYGRLHPNTAVDGVEIDGKLSEIGRRYFDMRGPRLNVITQDARPFLRRTRQSYDSIFVDAYRQPYIPFYLATREFFELVEGALRPGGSVIVNVGQPEGSHALERVLAATMRTSFTTVLRDRAQRTNTLLLASDSSASAARLRANAERVHPSVSQLARDAAQRLEPALRNGEIYTDDRAPVEWLVDGSLFDYARGARE